MDRLGLGARFVDEDEGYITIWVEVGQRTVPGHVHARLDAVLYDGDKKDKVGNTVVCFAPIPIECLYIDLPENIVNPIKDKFLSASGLKPGYQPLNGLGRNLTLVSRELNKYAK